MPSQVTVCAVRRHTHTRSSGTQATGWLGWADCAVLCVFWLVMMTDTEDDDDNVNKDSDGDEDNTDAS